MPLSEPGLTPLHCAASCYVVPSASYHVPNSLQSHNEQSMGRVLFVNDGENTSLAETLPWHITCNFKNQKGKREREREEGKCTHFIPLHSPKISHYHMGSCFAGLWIGIKDFVSSVLRTFHHFFLLAWKCNLKYFTRESFGVWKIILLCASICIWNQRQSWFNSDSHKGILIFTRNRLCLHMYTYCAGLKKEWGILRYLRASLLLFVLWFPPHSVRHKDRKMCPTRRFPWPTARVEITALHYWAMNTECELINRDGERYLW